MMQPPQHREWAPTREVGVLLWISVTRAHHPEVSLVPLLLTVCTKCTEHVGSHTLSRTGLQVEF